MAEKNKPRTAYFLIPIYNEASNIALLAENLSGVLPDENKYYIFSDDGSTDDGEELLKKHFEKEKYTILGDGTNHGPGFAFNSGFEWIIQNSSNDNDIVVTMEADNR